jgi:TetR/AcrR family transcriptional repressor of nem operon
MNATSGAQVREHILTVAKPLLLSRGFSAVGLNEILAAAGVPKGSFYHYFGSKEAFGQALLDTYFEGYLSHLDDVLVKSPGSAADRLMRYWDNWLCSQCADDPQGKCLAVKLGAEVADLSDAMRDALARGTRGIIERIAACIEAGLADGSLEGIAEPHETALSLYDLWLGATLLDKFHRNRMPLEAAMHATRQWLNLPGQRRKAAR